MSKHLFRAFKLIILFASINILSMHNHQLKKELAYQNDSDKKKEEYKDLLLSSPLSVSYFKQQSIALQSNDTHQYPLVFNRNQQPCITKYLLDGKPIAQLLQIDDEINFQSDVSNRYNFSLQIPYQVGSLTIATQGRFIFEKKINADSAYITGKTIDFYDAFFSRNGLIVQANSCKNNAQLGCSDFLFTGKKFEITPKSSLKTQNSLTATTESLLNEGMVDCKEDSSIESLLFKNSGTLTSHNLRFDGHRLKPTAA